MRRIAAPSRGRNHHYYRAGRSISISTESTRDHHLLSSSTSSCCCCHHTTTTNNNNNCGDHHRHRTKRRVAVTGLGVISPLGHDLQSTWRGVLCSSGKYDDNNNNNNVGMGITSLHSALQQQNLSPIQFEKEWAILKSLSCQVAASVRYEWIENHPHAHFVIGGSQTPPWLDGRTARFVQLVLIAAQEAIYNSGLQDWLNSHDDHHQKQQQQQQTIASLSSTGVFHQHDYDGTNIMRESYGVSIGNGMSSTRDISMTSSSKNFRKISPHFVPQILPNSPAARIAIHHQLRGPNLSHSEACAAGAAAIAQAVEMIQWGRVKGMVAGGCESAVEALGLAGFSRLRALSSSAIRDNATLSSRAGSGDNQHGEQNHENHVAQTSSCPFGSKRNGFVLAEGAAVLVLEEYEHAVARGAPILAEVLGVGYSGDAFHITAPEPSGRGAAKAMLQAVEDAGRSMNCVDYINTHATSTPMGDVAEIHAIRLALSRTTAEEIPSNPLLVSSTKGATGHLLGAAGAIEAALTVMAISEDTAPHTRNLDKVSDDVKQALEQFTDKEATATATHHRSIHLVQHEPTSQIINAAISNSFGFGGTNVSLLFGKAK